MGTTQGTNLILMHANHTNELAKYLILVFHNGKRIRLTFEGEELLTPKDTRDTE